MFVLDRDKLLKDTLAILMMHILVIILYFNYNVLITHFFRNVLVDFIQLNYFYNLTVDAFKIKINKPELLNFVDKIPLYLMLILYIFLIINFIKKIICKDLLVKKNILITMVFKKIIFHLYIITIWTDFTFVPIMALAVLSTAGVHSDAMSSKLVSSIIINLQFFSLLIPYSILFLRRIYINEKKAEKTNET